jgi:hypothetical protein
VGKPLVRFCEGLECDPRYGSYIVAPPGNQADTEKTNRFLSRGESPSYSNSLESGALMKLHCRVNNPSAELLPCRVRPLSLGK